MTAVRSTTAVMLVLIALAAICTTAGAQDSQRAVEALERVAPKILGDHYACVTGRSLGTASPSALRLNIVDPRARAKAKRAIRAAKATGRVRISVVPRRFSDRAMTRITGEIQREVLDSPRAALGFHVDETGVDCPVPMIYINDGDPQVLQMAERFQRRYGEDRVVITVLGPNDALPA